MNILLSELEVTQMLIFDRIKNKELKQVEAAKLLNLSERQVRRRYKRYLLDGAKGIAHKGKGRASNRSISTNIKVRIIEVLTTELKNLPPPKAGPTFLAEQLKKQHQIAIDHETLRRLMIKHCLWTMTSRKTRRHTWRERKHHIGELVQIDGSLHVWFGGGYCTLIAFIDDATSRIMLAKFVDHESTENLAQLTHEYIQAYGRPLQFYTDRGSAYKVSNNKDGLRHKTQYERMLQEIDTEIIHARSPQAKGRIERLFKTLQDRLVKELTLENITTLEAANKYLQETYIPIHNEKFAVFPAENADFHRPIEGFNLSSIFCLKHRRTISNDYTISFKNRWYQLEKDQPVILHRGDWLDVFESFDGTIRLFKKEKPLVFHAIKKRVRLAPIVEMDKEKRDDKRSRPYRKPPRNHPWNFRQPDISNEFKRGHF